MARVALSTIPVLVKLLPDPRHPLLHGRWVKVNHVLPTLILNSRNSRPFIVSLVGPPSDPS